MTFLERIKRQKCWVMLCTLNLLQRKKLWTLFEKYHRKFWCNVSNNYVLCSTVYLLCKKSLIVSLLFHGCICRMYIITCFLLQYIFWYYMLMMEMGLYESCWKDCSFLFDILRSWKRILYKHQFHMNMHFYSKISYWLDKNLNISPKSNTNCRKYISF